MADMLSFGSDSFAYLTAVDETEDIEWWEGTRQSCTDTSSVSLIQEKYQQIQREADDGQTCVLDILDTAGQEEYSSCREMYVRTGDCYVIVYDITRSDTFDEALRIFRWISRVTGHKEIHAILCGNKVDLEASRQVYTEVAFAKSKDLGTAFIECSAKTGHNIQEIFVSLMKITPRPGINYKVPILGAGAVGKTAITLQFCQGVFLDAYDPTIEDSYVKMVKVPDLPEARKSDTASAISHERKSRPKSTPGPGRLSSVKSKPTTWAKFKSVLPFRQLSLRALWGDAQTSSGATAETVVGDEEPGHGGEEPGRGGEQTPGCVKTIKVKAPNCNILAVRLGVLDQDLTITTGDAVFCAKCNAVLTFYAAGIEHGTMVQFEGSKYKWKCKYCHHGNKFHGSPDELNQVIAPAPVAEYLLSPPDENKVQEMNQGLVVYCIDVSGSMNTHTSVPVSQACWRDLKGHATTVVPTRLRCITQAICRQLERLQIEDPTKKVVIVTFESAVRVYVDGLAAHELTVENKGFDDLLRIGEQQSVSVLPLQESFTRIVGTVEGLETLGSTALGPALTLCCGLVRKYPFSEIILCTDGEPNAGIGSLTGDNKAGKNFYTQVGEYACGKNTKISIIGLEGQEVNMAAISQAAKLSGGSVTILNPFELARQVRLISQQPVIATNAEVQLFCHPCVHFFHDNKNTKTNFYKVNVGNVTTGTDLSFFFQMKPDYKEAIPKEIPFQVQVTYTKLDGSVHLRVITEAKLATQDREAMEESCNIAVVAMATNKLASKLVQQGQLDEAQKQLYAACNLIDRCAKTPFKKEEQCIAYQNFRDLDTEVSLARSTKARNAYSDRMTHVGMKIENNSLAMYSNIQAPCNIKMQSRKHLSSNADSTNHYYQLKDDL